MLQCCSEAGGKGHDENRWDGNKQPHVALQRNRDALTKAFSVSLSDSHATYPESIGDERRRY